MELSTKVLSDIIVWSKYSRYQKELGRRENWKELVRRNMNMHLEHYGHKISNSPEMEYLFNTAFEHVYDRKILPSMRSLQFAGTAIHRNPSRIFNCAYAPIDHTDFFSELMFLLLGGTGVGYSVQKRHISKLPKVQGIDKSKRRRRYKIGDNIEGWADSVKILIESYFYGKSGVNFDYSDIREKGSELVVTGGKAPGPAPLKIALAKIEAILEEIASGSRITPLQAHDICCHIADAVLAGGIRRAAMIALFSLDDYDMMTCKSGEWYETNPQRGRANNSVILHRDETSREEFNYVWDIVSNSGSGEPGIYWTSNWDWGTNPCAEIALKPFQFCNLTEVNVSDVKDQEDLNTRSRLAAVIGTLQAGYTDFHYLREVWRETTEKDALIGVGHTGISSGAVFNLDLSIAAEEVVQANAIVAELLGINVAARCTTVKPSGTSSLVLGTSSGIHAWHNPFYIRRIKLNKDEGIYKYLLAFQPNLIEDDLSDPQNHAFACIPVKAPEGSICRNDEGWEPLFERALWYNDQWVRKGHRKGYNSNNVSVTIYLREGEWEAAGEALWHNKDRYNGMSMFPFYGGTHKQMPHEDIDELDYLSLSENIHEIDLTQIMEDGDYTDLMGEAACAGGSCDIIM